MLWGHTGGAPNQALGLKAKTKLSSEGLDHKQLAQS